MQTFERVKRYLTFVTGLFECICFAGVIFGWASLVFVLKKEGYFSDLCASQHNTSSHRVKNYTSICDRQDERFALIFTMGSFMNNFITLPCGFVFDHFGTMATRFVGIFLYTSATLMIAFSTAASAVLLFPAICFLAVGGILFLLTNMQVGNLFGKKRSTIITLYNGAFDSSSAVFLVIKVLYETGMSLRNMFLFISCLSSIHIMRTYVLLPRRKIPYPVPEGYTYGLTCGKSDILAPTPEDETLSQREPLRAGEVGTDNEKDEGSDKTEGDAAEGQEAIETSEGAGLRSKRPEDSKEEKEEIPSFKSCLLSKLFLTHLLWMSVMQLRHYLYIGTLNPMLELLARGDTRVVSKYTNAFAFTQFFGVFCAPWNGLIMDRHKHRASSPDPASGCTASHRLADLKSAILSLTITVTQCLLFSICAAIPVLPVQYLTFVLQVVNRSFLYGGHAAFTTIGYPSCHFGKIYGMLMSLSAVVSLLQYACFALVRGPLQDDPMYMNIGFVVLVALTYVHPLNVYLQCRQEASQGKGPKPPQVEVPALGEKDRPAKESDI
ncbi:solute carrier family 43 member 3-like [Carcharodon carcharias]|uniref:solute carrier family 43 member 3-like n=1 Tax=Carcharodon carcharias TaxID=13397 RepID=UPI001B7E3EEC|nr:solute carrier family 43 member 3-like [Carcharodon carcharias]XP_041029787.1 solute carrier family 43 member 3-like [Carcharodon carcharias]